jgi:large subunit ribosomal protein L3
MNGVLGTKVGMTQVFDEANRIVPVTVVKAGPCVVTQVRTPSTDGYNAVQLAFGAVDPRKVNKPETGHFAKAGITPRRHLVELRTSDASSYEVGQEVSAEVFGAGAVVDVSGTTKGKGTGRRAPSAVAPPRRASSRARAWPAAWATSRPRRRT